MPRPQHNEEENPKKVLKKFRVTRYRTSLNGMTAHREVTTETKEIMAHSFSVLEGTAIFYVTNDDFDDEAIFATRSFDEIELIDTASSVCPDCGEGPRGDGTWPHAATCALAAELRSGGAEEHA